ncbi:diversity-generating retroelement protein Avd [Mycobacteroides abscessus]|uniref:diversity-generating retroelement protein Avd n=1 Tax=Mycobacteroides abscessus TaxID=36809 RepID=UPI000C25D7B5|nr:diversity-generating retroelement protein Avd [Mycobacteroides abscessus]
MNDLVILQKCYDMIQYGYICLRQYPKSEKHTLAAETKTCMLSLLKLIIQANKRYYKKTTLQDIDVELETLRHYIRLAQGLTFLPFNKYENWTKMLSEIGRLLGGWMKSIKQ